MKTGKNSIFNTVICVSVIYAVLMTFSSCNDEVVRTVSYMVNEPVYMSFTDFRTPPQVKSVRTIVSPGKICLYEDYIFVNEPYKGFHIINNANPASPHSVGFVELPGNVDLAVKNDMLFADSYVDLVWFDLLQPANPKETGRLTDVFTNVLPPVENNCPTLAFDNTKGVVISWNTTTFTTKEPFRIYPNWESYSSLASADGAKTGNTLIAGSSSGKTGSMARFASFGTKLYTISNFNELNVFSVSGKNVTKGMTQYARGNAETIFAYRQKLFIGTTTGMLIYNIENLDMPEFLSSVSHIVGCDPVVVQGDFAYLTVRSGNLCGQSRSLLEVLDISNPALPVSLATFDMEEPYGLGIDGNTLFVCDNGLKVFDASTPQRAGNRLTKYFHNIDGYDVIPNDNILILIGKDGLFQYDYSDVKNIQLLSVLKFTTGEKK